MASPFPRLRGIPETAGNGLLRCGAWCDVAVSSASETHLESSPFLVAFPAGPVDRAGESDIGIVRELGNLRRLARLAFASVPSFVPFNLVRLVSVVKVFLSP
jgi:hypothetical protein